MRHRHNNHKPSTTSHPNAQLQDRVLAPHTTTGRVLVIETLHAAEDIIRVSIETVRSVGQPERVIAF
jgi:hypothetical protein